MNVMRKWLWLALMVVLGATAIAAWGGVRALLARQFRATLDQAKQEIQGSLQNKRTKDMMDKVNGSFQVETNEAYFGPMTPAVPPLPYRQHLRKGGTIPCPGRGRLPGRRGACPVSRPGDIEPPFSARLSAVQADPHGQSFPSPETEP